VAGAAVPSHLIDYQLFGDQFSTAEMRAVFDERTMLQRWLDVEAALAAAQEELGLIPPGTAAAIAQAAKVEALDLETVRRDLAVTAHPIVPIVRELARLAGEAGRWVHWGATTQDIMDTGMVLQLRAAHAILRRDLVALTLALADLAERHRDTVMAGRTHAQQALPITFGFKVATWTAECVRRWNGWTTRRRGSSSASSVARWARSPASARGARRSSVGPWSVSGSACRRSRGTRRATRSRSS